MTETANTNTTTTTPTTKKRRRTRLLEKGMEVDRVPPESRRHAACVLEVLAGVRRPEAAASVLGISLPSYYNLETRALRGLVHGCMPEPPGRRVALAKRVREAEARCDDLQRQVQRYQALLRSAQRAAGMGIETETSSAGPAGRKKKSSSTAAKTKPGPRTRSPRVRALRAIEALGGAAPAGSTEHEAEQAS